MFSKWAVLAECLKTVFSLFAECHSVKSPVNHQPVQNTVQSQNTVSNLASIHQLFLPARVLDKIF